MGSIIAGLIAAAAAVTGSIISYNAGKKANEANKEINEHNLEYNTYMTQEQWERDDTAHQREVADLKAAGLSPLANTSGSQVTSALGSPSAIPMQAPQFDVNSLVQSVMQAGNLQEEVRHNKVTEKNRSSELQIEAEKVKISAENLKLENKKVDEEIRYQTRLNELAQSNLDELIRSHKKDESLRLSAQESLDLERETQRMAIEIKNQTGGKDIPIKKIYDFDTYCVYMKLRNIRYQNLIDELKATQKSSAESGSSSFGIGAGVSGFGPTGLGGNGNVSNMVSNSNYSSENISQRQQEIINKFNQENPFPVFINKADYPHYYRGDK